MDCKREPVTVSKGGFVFCRWSVAVILWCAFVWRIKILVVLVFLILLASALLTVRRAPMIKLFDWTLGRLFPTAPTELDLYGMRFAHALGSLFALVCIVFLYAGARENIGWAIVLAFCFLKTISASGFCPASKLYGCMSSGTCCAFLKKSP